MTDTSEKRNPPHMLDAYQARLMMLPSLTSIFLTTTLNRDPPSITLSLVQPRLCPISTHAAHAGA